MNNAPFITIIIPCFNVQPLFFEACLQSVLNQTSNDFECLAIYSDDSLVHFVNDPHYQRITFVPNTIKSDSPSGDRNLGVSLAKGEYLAFLDADDQLSPQFVECSKTIVRKQKADLYVFEGNHDGDFSLLGSLANQMFPQNLLFQDIVSLFSMKPLSTPDLWHPFTLWGKLFSKDFIQRNKLRFPLARKSEDRLFFLWALRPEIICNVLSVDFNSYFYRRHPQSLSRTNASARPIGWYADFIHLVFGFFRRHQPERLEMVRSYLFDRLINITLPQIPASYLKATNRDLLRELKTLRKDNDAWSIFRAAKQMVLTKAQRLFLFLFKKRLYHLTALSLRLTLGRKSTW